jgi:O-acetyl-ADP-ribose deacetylase (regulator of RNase III)
MYELYRQWCSVDAMEAGETMVFYDGPSDMFICNIASQDNPGPFARLEWLESGVKVALEHLDFVQVSTLALPRIGSGIGGLNEADVEEVLTRLAESSPVDIELWTYKG